MKLEELKQQTQQICTIPNQIQQGLGLVILGSYLIRQQLQQEQQQQPSYRQKQEVEHI